jgi:hypothetical protein
LLLVYVALITVSLILYPEPFNILTTPLAQLGNPVANPSGYLAYSIAIIVVSLPIVLIVALSLTLWRQNYSKTFQKGEKYFYATATFFLLFALFEIFTAIVPSGTNDILNGLLSMAFFISFQSFVIISAIGIKGNTNHTRWIPEMGFVIAITNTLLFGIALFTGFYIATLAVTVLSWAYVLAFINETI